MSVIFAAPASDSGKTTITLGVLRALTRDGVAVRGAKSGPDYIDPRFLAAASGSEAINLDAWAMSPEMIRSLAAGPLPLIVEGAMGLFDGAGKDSKGATADLATQLGLPVILVVDAGRMAGSIAPLVRGFMTFREDVKVAGVILNFVASPRHEEMLREALAGIPVLGAVPREAGIALPARHLGLVQAHEHDDLTAFLDGAADLVKQTCDLTAIKALLQPMSEAAATPAPPPPPPAQSIAIAEDAAFAFCYPHMLAAWKAAGASLSFFSPLADEAPATDADLIFLPGGYPELHAPKLAANTVFLEGLRSAQALIYGECGGFMVLGEGLIDAEGTRHQMAGLLALETSFASRKLSLGYRDLQAAVGPFAGHWKGHEFHYATTTRAEGTPLFLARNARGDSLAPMGLVSGRVMGSFAHLIAPA